MVANLSGIRFDQVYGDNSGGAEFDTDGDGTATQEDEFVSFTNDSGSAMDISGWQIWSDSSGTGAPDTPQDGLFHTFPPGTVLATGQTLFVINEITGTAPDWAQEASQGGTESGAGGVNTNFLSEGTNGGAATDGVALVNPATGEYIVFNLAANPHIFSSMPGFPGTTMVGEVDGAAVQEDQNAGSVYRYNSGTDSYDYTAMSFACFASGTRLLTSSGLVPVEHLCVGAPLVTRDHGLQRIE